MNNRNQLNGRKEEYIVKVIMAIDTRKYILTSNPLNEQELKIFLQICEKIKKKRNHNTLDVIHNMSNGIELERWFVNNVFNGRWPIWGRLIQYYIWKNTSNGLFLVLIDRL